MRNLVFAATVALAAAAAAPTPSLPSAFLGAWGGIAEYTVLGPMADRFNFTIASAGAPSRWLMEDTFMGYLIRGSVQQFWVEVNDARPPPALNGTLVYCGHLTNFFNAIGPHGGDIEVAYQLSNFSESALVFVLRAPYWGIEAKWSLTLSADGETLTSHHQLPDSHGGVNHLKVALRRLGPAAEAERALSPKAAAMLRAARHAAVGGRFTPPCTLPNTTDADAAAAAARVAAARAAGEATLCPHGFTAADGPMPSFVRRRLDRARHRTSNAAVNQLVALATGADKRSTDSNSFDTTHDAAYQHCYLLNPALGYKLRHTWHTGNQTVDVLFSAKIRPGDGGGRADNSWVGLGVFPNWPAMQGMDVVLGYMAHTPGASAAPVGCVRAMYAEYYVGTPVDNANQTLTSTKVWTSGDEVFVQYTRAWDTGYQNYAAPAFQTAPVVSFAVGQAAATCDAGGAAQLGYHFGARGSMGWLWPDPGAMLPESMKCRQA